MPGLDHATHHSTVKQPGSKAGCWNRPPFKLFYWARTVDYNVVPPLDKWVQVPHALSTECRFDQRMNPEQCEGCMHINKDYDRMVRKEGT